jgi:hypothetical protein
MGAVIPRIERGRLQFQTADVLFFVLARCAADRALGVAEPASARAAS